MNAPRVPLRPVTVATWAALVVVYIVWGSTYLAIRILDRSVPPMLGMGTRFICAGTLLALILVARHGPGVLRVPPRRALAAGLVGVLLLGGGNGAVAMAERTVPSGLAALVVAAVPLWLVCLRLLARDIPHRATIAGTVIGFGGIAVLTVPGSSPAGGATRGLLVLLAGTLSWAAGSFLSPRLPLPGHPFVATVYEMLTAGVVLLASAAVTGETAGFSPALVPASGWLALGYLVMFGSIAGFSAYVWLLGNAPLSLTATYAYVNPVIAVALGALVLAEPITPAILIGGAVVITGVGLVVSAERTGRRRRGTPRARAATARPAGAPGEAAPRAAERK